MTLEPTSHADTVRAALRAQLTAAMKARDRDEIAALRSAISVIDNAESVDPAGARTGATEVERRRLSAADVSALLHNQVRDYLAEAGSYEALGRAAAAAPLRRQAEVIRRHL
ncbi:Uncharacterised protein [Mycolicibacterium vanbaalenii]|uniref:Uncharacterized protein n=1 Tax=Mycolicibacterium vanbaalenii TaxID=110539 RepID=A0A5S9RBZ7_MYCVN|nr:GatB/YqeY domain-containing protein [Mycolicibacterium vanbaalenii]CAA0136511.1 Uncharacterised protein [Mycolicibacterium vanbaalenii]